MRLCAIDLDRLWSPIVVENKGPILFMFEHETRAAEMADERLLALDASVSDEADLVELKRSQRIWSNSLKNGPIEVGLRKLMNA